MPAINPYILCRTWAGVATLTEKNSKAELAFGSELGFVQRNSLYKSFLIFL